MSVRLMGTGARIIGQSKKRSAVAALRKLTREALQGEPSLAVFRGGVRLRGKRKPASLGGGARRASGVGDNEKRGEEESATPAVTQISVSRDQPFYARSVALVEGNVACLGLDHFLIPSTSEITAVTLVMATSGNPDVNRFLSC